jgi:hypothetical protein
VGNIAWTPLRFSLAKGHARSAWLERAVDRKGRALPWYTYPAIDFLSNKRFSGKAVLEFGSGQSSLWWASQGVTLTSLEDNPRWRDYVASNLPGRAEVLFTPTLDNIPQRVLDRRYDVIVIDGLRRQDAARLAVSTLVPGGAIIFDNSEGFWSDDDSKYEVVELMHQHGFSRVDFYGFAPGNISETCTSIYFKDRCFLFETSEPPRMPRY